MRRGCMAIVSKKLPAEKTKKPCHRAGLRFSNGKSSALPEFFSRNNNGRGDGEGRWHWQLLYRENRMRSMGMGFGYRCSSKLNRLFDNFSAFGTPVRSGAQVITARRTVSFTVPNWSPEQSNRHNKKYDHQKPVGYGKNIIDLLSE